MADCDTGELSKVVVIQIFFEIFSGTRKGQENKARAGGRGWRSRSLKAVEVSDAGRGGFDKETVVMECSQKGKETNL